MAELRYFKTNTGYSALVPSGKSRDSVSIVIDGVKDAELTVNGSKIRMCGGRAAVPISALNDGKNTVFLDTGTGIEALEPFELHGRAIMLPPLSDDVLRRLHVDIFELRSRIEALENTVKSHGAKIDSTIF